MYDYLHHLRYFSASSHLVDIELENAMLSTYMK
jgi:hypothetical protein